MGKNSYKFDKSNLCYIYGEYIDDDVNFAIKNENGDKIFDIISGQVFDLKFRGEERYKQFLGEAKNIMPFISRDGKELSVVNGLPFETVELYERDYNDIRVYILRKILEGYKKSNKFSLSELKYINSCYNKFIYLQAKHRKIMNEKFARKEERRELKQDRQKNKEMLELQKEQEKKREIMSQLFGENEKF